MQTRSACTAWLVALGLIWIAPFAQAAQSDCVVTSMTMSAYGSTGANFLAYVTGTDAWCGVEVELKRNGIHDGCSSETYNNNGILPPTVDTQGATCTAENAPVQGSACAWGIATAFTRTPLSGWTQTDQETVQSDICYPTNQP